MTSMNRIALVTLLFGAQLAHAPLAHADARPPAGATALVDRPVAIVDRTPIWQSEFTEALAMTKVDATSPEARAGVLDTLINRTLLLAAASVLHVEVATAEIDAAVQQIEQQNHFDDAGLDKALGDIGISRARYRDELAAQIRLLRVDQLAFRPRISVSEEDLQRAYTELKLQQPATGPLDDKLKDSLRDKLTEERVDAERTRWLAMQRRTSHIVRLP
jgi:parvulin-like peptidyl-prolyl isomerase